MSESEQPEGRDFKPGIGNVTEKRRDAKLNGLRKQRKARLEKRRQPTQGSYTISRADFDVRLQSTLTELYHWLHDDTLKNDPTPLEHFYELFKFESKEGYGHAIVSFDELFGHPEGEQLMRRIVESVNFPNERVASYAARSIYAMTCGDTVSYVQLLCHVGVVPIIVEALQKTPRLMFYDTLTNICVDNAAGRDAVLDTPLVPLLYERLEGALRSADWPHIERIIQTASATTAHYAPPIQFYGDLVGLIVTTLMTIPVDEYDTQQVIILEYGALFLAEITTITNIRGRTFEDTENHRNAIVGLVSVPLFVQCILRLLQATVTCKESALVVLRAISSCGREAIDRLLQYPLLGGIFQNLLNSGLCSSRMQQIVMRVLMHIAKSGHSAELIDANLIPTIVSIMEDRSPVHQLRKDCLLVLSVVAVTANTPEKVLFLCNAPNTVHVAMVHSLAYMVSAQEFEVVQHTLHALLHMLRRVMPHDRVQLVHVIQENDGANLMMRISNGTNILTEAHKLAETMLEAYLE